MTVRARMEKPTSSQISFPPTDIVRIDGSTMRELHEVGLRFRNEIEKRSAPMFVTSTSESSTKMR